MRSLVIALSLTSATFAATTVYFARELQLERERPLAAPATKARAPPASAQVLQPQITPQAAATTPPPSHAVPSATVESEEDRRKKFQAEHHRKTIQALEDPRRREHMLIQTKMSMRSSYPRLAQAIGMTTEEVDRLLTLLAEQQLSFQEDFSRCTLEGNCNVHGNVHLTGPHALEIADLLGAERQQQFEAYKNTLMERESVTQLRTRLSDANRLPDGDAEALVAALADERQRIHQEAAERHAGVNGVGFGAGMIFFGSDAQSPEDKIASAQSNVSRMRERAALVLTAEQLRVFDEMQAEQMFSLRDQILRKEDPATASTYNPATVAD
jgi:hypothetical protein